jgi:CrcB protein
MSAERRTTEQPAHHRLSLVALVALGGLIGTTGRYAVSGWLGTSVSGWPTATFTVNIVGSLALGALLEALARRGAETSRAQAVRLLVGTGVIGSFTTFSSLAEETDLLVRGSSTGLAVGYAVSSLAVGLVATVLGIAAAARAGAR